MTITLRELATGKPVGAGHVAQRIIAAKLGGWYVVDNWSEGTCKVYARSNGHIPPAPIAEFDPSELGLYIGHERGQPISEIKWGGQQFRSRVQFTDDELLTVHMALRYLRDHGLERTGSTAREVAALLAKIGTLPGHKDEV